MKKVIKMHEVAVQKNADDSGVTMKVIDDGGFLREAAREVREWCERKEWRVPGDRSLPDAKGRTFGDEIALLHSELSEALEAFRTWGTEPRLHFKSADGFAIVKVGDPNAARWIADGQVPKPEGVGSELADLLIRLLDTCEHLDVNLFQEYRRKMDYNETREVRHGGKAL